MAAGLNSRVHLKYKAKYRVSNWAQYDQALIQRGDITPWITPKAIKGWAARPSGRRGARRKYADLAIETALTLRLLFRLPLRQAEGFLRSLLDLMDLGLEAPDHTTLSRRGRDLRVDLGLATSKNPIHLIIDSTGLSIVGEGDWATAKRGKRGWRKLHLGVDRAGMIREQVLTDSSGDDARTGLKAIKKTRGELASVTGDAPTARWPSTTRLRLKGREPSSLQRDRHPRLVANQGPLKRDKNIERVAKVGRRRWKKESGYHRQGAIENAFFPYKSMLGGRLHARGLSAQRTEVAIGCKISNRLLVLVRPRSVAIAS